MWAPQPALDGCVLDSTMWQVYTVTDDSIEFPNPIGQHDYVHLLKIVPMSLNKTVVA